MLIRGSWGAARAGAFLPQLQWHRPRSQQAFLEQMYVKTSIPPPPRQLYYSAPYYLLLGILKEYCSRALGSMGIQELMT